MTAPTAVVPCQLRLPRRRPLATPPARDTLRHGRRMRRRWHRLCTLIIHYGRHPFISLAARSVLPLSPCASGRVGRRLPARRAAGHRTGGPSPRRRGCRGPAHASSRRAPARVAAPAWAAGPASARGWGRLRRGAVAAPEPGRLPLGTGRVGMRTWMPAVRSPGVELVALLRPLHAVERPRCFSIVGGVGFAGPGPVRLPLGTGPVGMRTRMAAVRCRCWPRTPGRLPIGAEPVGCGRGCRRRGRNPSRHCRKMASGRVCAIPAARRARTPAPCNAYGAFS